MEAARDRVKAEAQKTANVREEALDLKALRLSTESEVRTSHHVVVTPSEYPSLTRRVD